MDPRCGFGSRQDVLSRWPPGRSATAVRVLRTPARAASPPSPRRLETDRIRPVSRQPHGARPSHPATASAAGRAVHRRPRGPAGPASPCGVCAPAVAARDRTGGDVRRTPWSPRCPPDHVERARHVVHRQTRARSQERDNAVQPNPDPPTAPHGDPPRPHPSLDPSSASTEKDRPDGSGRTDPLRYGRGRDARVPNEAPDGG